MNLPERQSSSNSGGVGRNSFLKIAAGQSIKGVFRGELFSFFQHWPKGGQKKVSDTYFPMSGRRHRANFAIYDEAEKKFVLKIFEFGNQVYDQMATINKHMGDITKLKIVITRQGEEKKTTYTLLPLVNEAIPAKVMKELDGLEPLDLEPVELREPVAEPAAQDADKESLPF